MHILVYGAGVLGSLCAARLQESGCTVSILARGQRLLDIQEHGIVLEDAHSGWRTTTYVNVVEQLLPDAAYDLVIVLMRKQQVSEILPSLAANKRIPIILFMVNNAIGPDEWIHALGGERIVLGFPGAGGTREGLDVKYHILPRWQQATTFGELDGHTSPRLTQIVNIFSQAGFPVETSSNIDAWLKTHVTWITAAATALYLAGGHTKRMAHTRDAIILMVRAVREGFHVLRTLGVPITPRNLEIFEWLPEPLLVALLQRLFDTKIAELVVAKHANAARDEMAELVAELQTLSSEAGVPTPVMERLFRTIDVEVPSIAEGSTEIPLNWRSLAIGSGIFAGVLFLLLWFRLRTRK